VNASYLSILASVADELAARDPSLSARLRAAAAKIEAAPPERRDRIAAALRVLDPRLVTLPATPRGPVLGMEVILCETYPRAMMHVQARLVLGESPAEVTGLTAREAHEYLSHVIDSAISPAEWLLRSIPSEDVVNVSLSARNVPVARWIVARFRDHAQRDALLRERVERGPHGEEVRGRYVDRLDELTSADLRPSVRETFDRAARRLTASLERDLRRAKNQAVLASTPRWWRPVRCAVLLDKPGLLAAEGREMRHCVAVYVPYVRRERSVIVSIQVHERRGGVDVTHRSTVEIDREKIEVRQHKGRDNTEPPALCIAALEVCLQRWRKR